MLNGKGIIIRIKKGSKGKDRKQLLKRVRNAGLIIFVDKDISFIVILATGVGGINSGPFEKLSVVEEVAKVENLKSRGIFL